MNRKRSFGRPFAWILLAVCFLPVALRAEVQAPSNFGAGEPLAVELTAPGARRLTAVQATTDQDEVRVFLQTSGNITARPFMLDSPSRLVVDLEGAQSALKKSWIDVSSPLVSRVRVGQHREGSAPITRVVLDLAGPSPYHIDRAPGGILVTVEGSRTGTTGSAAAAEIDADGRISAFRSNRALAQPETTGEGAPVDAAPSSAVDQGGRPFAASAQAAVPSAPTPAGASSPPAFSEAVNGPSRSLGEPAPGRGVASATAPEEADAQAGIAEPVMGAQDPGRIQPSSATNDAKPLSPSSATREAKLVRPASNPKLEHGGATFESRTITGENRIFTGKKISLNLVDADIKQVFRLFHEISGLNFVLDPSVSGTVTIVLDEVPWDQALDLILKNNGLDKVYEANVIRIASTQKLASEASGRKTLREAKELEVEPVTITRRLSYAKAKDVDQIIKTGVLLSQRGKSFFDDRTNMLIITDVPTKIEPLDKLISDLDAKTPQVLIEARIVLTGRDFIQDLGIDWGFTLDRNSPRDFSNANNFPHHGEVTYALNLPRAAAASRLAFDLFNRSGSFNLQVALDALEVDGRSRTLSAPKIATQNNVKAEIEQGVQIPIANSTATEISVEFVSASLKLSVTPQITAEGTVIMDVTVENNQPSKTLRLESGIPGIDTQRAQTKVIVEDGGTTVIGGIFSVNEGTSESGVPWLRKIPIFGWLFKSRNITVQNRELLIFITPKILKST